MDATYLMYTHASRYASHLPQLFVFYRPPTNYISPSIEYREYSLSNDLMAMLMQMQR